MDLSEFLLAWRTTPLPDREVIDALVHPAHAAPSVALAAALARWPGSYYWSDEPAGRHLVLTRPLGRRRERWGLHLGLLLLTFYTVTFAGAVIASAIPYTGPLVFFTRSHAGDPGFWSSWATGLRFSVPLIAILLCHELGHYLVARRYQLDVSPPYFIPAPMLPTFIGTMGAFIRLRTIVSDRRQLLDVGAAGPIAGFLVALPVFVLGLLMSHAAAPVEGVRGLVVYFGDVPQIPLGDSLLTLALRHWLLGPATLISVDPIAFAGWVGLLVTMLNLVPMSQLDGGHVLYAALPGWHRRIALGFWTLILGLGWYWWGWLVWGFLVLALSRGRLNHPSVLDTQRPLPPSRRALAWAVLGLFLLTFAPVPFRI
ncbi:MAG TPA: site-2 protease family protein [Gemmatimonadales bacterium]|nr:site-2 protease family protein [Gemmatimonadales bacterium]